MLGLMLILVALAVAAYLAFSRRLARSESWTAMVTPLASIMGSGFLVSAPLLAHEVGNLAVLCMAVLLALAYALGGALRFNIRHFEPIEHTEKGAAQSLAHISSSSPPCRSSSKTKRRHPYCARARSSRSRRRTSTRALRGTRSTSISPRSAATS